MPTEPLPSRLEGVPARVPATMSEFTGPDRGRVVLPAWLAWSGLVEFDVDDSKERLTLYRTLLDCGQRADIARYINARLLRQDWPRIRRLTGRSIIAIWEWRLPDLAAIV